jgi:hypothetical protein
MLGLRQEVMAHHSPVLPRSAESARDMGVLCYGMFLLTLFGSLMLSDVYLMFMLRQTMSNLV